MTIRCKDCGCVSTVLSSGGGDCEICRHMTNHNDPIDRALERLQSMWKQRDRFTPTLLLPILTDLVAESKESKTSASRILYKRRAERAEARLASLEQASDAITAAHLDAEARLAAVEDYIYRYKGQCASEPELIRHLGPLMDILAVARGEGGEQANQPVAGDEGKQNRADLVVAPATPNPRCARCGAAIVDGEHAGPCWVEGESDVAASSQDNQGPAPPDPLDEIVEDSGLAVCALRLDLNTSAEQFVDVLNDTIRAACIRARKTDPKLAAVRAWRDKWRGCLKLWDELDAILDGKEDDHE